MTETVTAVLGGLVGLITAGSIAYTKIQAIKLAHIEKMQELKTANDIAQADAAGKLKTAEDKRQNEAFDRLSTAFDGQIKLYADLLIRMAKVEDDHSTCQQKCSTLEKQNGEQQKSIETLTQKVTYLEGTLRKTEDKALVSTAVLETTANLVAIAANTAATVASTEATKG